MDQATPDRSRATVERVVREEWGYTLATLVGRVRDFDLAEDVLQDAGVAALCARSAVMGAFLNVKINTADLEDQALKADFLKRGAELQQKAIDKEAEILAIVNGKM